MRAYILTSTIATACAVSLAAAQVPTDQQNPQASTTTITGCLYHERDIPGRTPNVAERAGVLEDYILADVSGAAAAGKMYKVEHLDDNRLREFVGKRVEVTGRIDDDDAQRPTGTSGAADRSAGPDRIELPEFEAASIREIAGSCPAKPSAGAPGALMSEQASATQSATATETEAQTRTAPVTETPSHPAAQPQPQPQATPAPVTEAPSHPAAQPKPEPQPPAPPAPVTQTPTYPQTTSTAATITLSGCLYRERDVPGRTPNIAERAGILEDYILADASVSPGPSTSSAGTAGATGTSGGSEAPAIGKMFKVEHIGDEKLAQFVGKRVEVTGKIDTEKDEMKQAGTAGTSGSSEDRSAGPDQIELPEFEASSIREIAGSCPATPQK